MEPVQPAPRDVPVRQGLVARTLQRAHDRAAGAAADRAAGRLERGHQWDGRRRGRARADRHRSGHRTVPRQARRQDRPHAARPRGLDARRPHRPSDDAGRIRGSGDDADSGGPRARRTRRRWRPGSGRQQLCGRRSRSSTSRKGSSRCSIAAATATRRRLAATSTRGSSAPTAARSSRRATVREPRTPDRRCRR